MGLFNYFKKDIFHSPEYFERLGECNHDCLVCDHIDIDCHGDDDWEIEVGKGGRYFYSIKDLKCSLPMLS